MPATPRSSTRLLVGSAMAMIWYNERLTIGMLIGSGLFILWRAHKLVPQPTRQSQVRASNAWTWRPKAA